MAEIKVRGLGADVVVKLDEMAEKRNISREEYLRRHLTHIAALGEIREVEDKYVTLVNNLMEVIQLNTDVMERINFYLDCH